MLFGWGKQIGQILPVRIGTAKPFPHWDAYRFKAHGFCCRNQGSCQWRRSMQMIPVSPCMKLFIVDSSVLSFNNSSRFDSTGCPSNLSIWDNVAASPKLLGCHASFANSVSSLSQPAQSDKFMVWWQSSNRCWWKRLDISEEDSF